jgi:hypothetical protein
MGIYRDALDEPRKRRIKPLPRSNYRPEYCGLRYIEKADGSDAISPGRQYIQRNDAEDCYDGTEPRKSYFANSRWD